MTMEVEPAALTGTSDESVTLNVSDAVPAVVGVPDQRWGERIGAVVVPTDSGLVDTEELRDWVRARLRSSKTPEWRC